MFRPSSPTLGESGAGPDVPQEDSAEHSNHLAGTCLLSLGFIVHEMGLLWDELHPPFQLIMSRSSTPGPSNVTVLGEKAFKEMIKMRSLWWSLIYSD